MIRTFTVLFRALCLGAVLVLAGCLGSSEPTRYYVLSELDAPADTGTPDLLEPAEALLLVGPVSLPRYLDRPQIVTRTSANELVFGEFDHWSEPLEESFDRVLAENLGQLLPTESRMLYPKRGPEIANVYQLTVEVTRFDGELGGDVVLTVRWNVVDQENRNILPLDKATYREATGGEGYVALVAALNRTMERLCRDIAVKIREAVQEQQRQGGV